MILCCNLFRFEVNKNQLTKRLLIRFLYYDNCRANLRTFFHIHAVHIVKTVDIITVDIRNAFNIFEETNKQKKTFSNHLHFSFFEFRLSDIGASEGLSPFL